MRYYIQNGKKVYIHEDIGRRFNYRVGHFLFRTSIGIILAYDIDLSFTYIAEDGKRKLSKEFFCLDVNETEVQKEILTDEEGEYFLSNDLKVIPGGVSMGPIFVAEKYKIRIYNE